jgi:DNA modification methylase
VNATATILVGDVFDRLADIEAGSVQTCVTSPPYWGLRDYGHDGQLGLESTPDEYVARMVDVFRAVRRVLADDGTVWLNLGDSYASGGVNALGRNDAGRDIGGGGNTLGSGNPGRQGAIAVDNGNLKPKDLVGIPWRVAFALQADGWWLRQDIIWHKPNPMPESVTDRCTKSHEYVFLLAKSARYFYDHDAIAEQAGASNYHDATGGGYAPVGQQAHTGSRKSGNKERKAATLRGAPSDGVCGNVPWEGTTRNRRDVWTIATKPFSGAHFAVMPTALAEPCVLAGSRPGDLVLDPFTGSGTVGVVALRHSRNFIGTELSAEYAEIAERRICDDAPMFNQVVTA